ncbi:uncharacterized protein [Acropora muricata]|uniref:uncharacterized protein n=1 Tax=Acropora muricata TaxID=159855 RepID=UPI0034E54E44
MKSPGSEKMMRSTLYMVKFTWLSVIGVLGSELVYVGEFTKRWRVGTKEELKDGYQQKPQQGLHESQDSEESENDGEGITYEEFKETEGFLNPFVSLKVFIEVLY